MASFFLICLLLLPLASASQVSTPTAISFILIAMWIASITSGADFFYSDYQCGSLEVWLNARLHPFIIIITKVIHHWCMSALVLTPLILISALLFNLTLDVCLMLVFVAVIGLFSVSFLIAFGDALLLNSKQSKLLLPVIIFPFLLATVIFAAQAVFSIHYNNQIQAFALIMLGLQAALHLLFTPWGILIALRMSVQYA